MIDFLKIIQADDPKLHHLASLGNGGAVADDIPIHEPHPPSGNEPAQSKHGSSTARDMYKRHVRTSRTAADGQKTAGTDPGARSNRLRDSGHCRRF